MGTGAAIGAGSGLLVGTAVGANRGEAAGRTAQQQYDISYQQCMYAKGNLVPGMAQPPRRVQRSIPPPPPPDINNVPPDYPGNYGAPQMPPGQ